MAIRQIRIEDIGKFSIDDQNRLYWDGKILQTEAVVVLNTKQNILAVATAIAAIIAALATAINAGANVWGAFFRTTTPVVQQQTTPAPLKQQIAPQPPGKKQ